MKASPSRNFAFCLGFSHRVTPRLVGRPPAAKGDRLVEIGNAHSRGPADGAGQGPGGWRPAEGAYGWTGEFINRALEQRFCETAWLETTERVRAIQTGVYLFACWVVLDFLILGPTVQFVVIGSLRVATLAIGRIPFLFFDAPHRQAALRASLTFVQAYIFGVFLLLVSAGGFGAADHAVSAAVITIAFYFGVPNRLAYNAALSIACGIAFTVVIAFYPDMSLTSAMQIFMLLMVANAVGFQAMRVTNRLRRNQFLTMEHQRELNEQLTQEISVRQEAQRVMRATEESFQSIFVAAPLPLALIDPATYRIVQANKAALELFGLNGEDAAHIDARRFFVDDEMKERLGEAAAGSRLRGPIEARLLGGEGTVIWAHITAALVRFQGLPALLIGLQDVTARRKEAEALREARDDATAASRSKSEFLANMSHELRTPLNAIIGFSEALERELFGPVGNPRYREYAEDIHDSGVHLLNLINDILDLSKIEAGHFKLHEDETDLDAVVASACRIVRHRAQQSAITIEVSLPTPPISLVADERALKQVLINLMSNAVKFSADGSTVRVEAAVQPGRLRIAVIDHGIGIAEADIPKALAPFTQIDGTLSRAHEGTGLGLPLAKHLTELHGGSLMIESTPGEGTTVYADLPASRLVAQQSHIRAGW
ncbi:PAS domain S-box protein [Parvibaculum sedimenti]|uniref:histidine kinase n=1 Tax=Parvibaculum sedimenti TaxID=2608632 RepID=A0A6N6VLH7_9HYPH|nr:PAS domain S-box protein [Parvibaculum sedimenti]